jgi:hypothetical protein
VPLTAITMSLLAVDPKLVIDALRLIIEGWRAYRTTRGRQESEDRREEEVLQEAVRKAEGMTAEGADAEKVVREVGADLDRELGSAATNDILGRLNSIIALAHPFDLNAFRYFESLTRTLSSAREFCKNTNLFALRATIIDGVYYLELADVGQSMSRLFVRNEALRNGTQERNVIDFSIRAMKAFLRSDLKCFSIVVPVTIRRISVMGSTEITEDMFALSLRDPAQVNRLGFHIDARPLPLYTPDFEFLLRGEDFRELVESLLSDLAGYIKELSFEERDFEQKFEPALRGIGSALKNLEGK